MVCKCYRSRVTKLHLGCAEKCSLCPVSIFQDTQHLFLCVLLGVLAGLLAIGVKQSACCCVVATLCFVVQNVLILLLACLPMNKTYVSPTPLARVLPFINMPLLSSFLAAMASLLLVTH